jgi:hypothetical protein
MEESDINKTNHSFDDEMVVYQNFKKIIFFRQRETWLTEYYPFFFNIHK